MNYRGGRIKRGQYWYLHLKDHPFSGKQGYIAEHRIVMEKHLGRFLNHGETVHHINHDSADNRIENLELFSSPGQHTKIRHSEIFERHRIEFKGKEPPNKNHVPHICPMCNKKFLANPNRKRKFCSQECLGQFLRGRRISPRTEFQKGLIPWNKGKKMKPESIEKMRQKNKGKHFSPSTEFKKGCISKNRIESEVTCLFCRKNFHVAPSRVKRTKTCSKECRRENGWANR